MAIEAKVARRGIYNNEYLSGANVSLYIGDVWVDEVTTLSYGYQQSRTPIYGYASTLFDDVSEGHILVTGQFTINFKEAGYLWLILNRYRELNKNRASLTASSQHPFKNSGLASRAKIEQIINGDANVLERNRAFQEMAEKITAKMRHPEAAGYATIARQKYIDFGHADIHAGLGGFASTQRAIAAGQAPDEKRYLGKAENEFEAFENAVWKRSPRELDEGDDKGRRTDDYRLNPFEIYVAFGDFAGDDTANHTIERIRNVYILGKSKQIVIDGMSIQEQYTFLSRNIV